MVKEIGTKPIQSFKLYVKTVQTKKNHGSGLSFLHKCCIMYFVMLFSLPETVIKNIESLTKKGENMSIFVRGLLYSSILCRVCV